MSLEELLVHPVVVWRATPGAVDEYNNPSQVWAILAAVDSRIVAKSGRETPQTNQSGPRAGQFKVFLAPTDVVESDHIVRQDPAEVYEIGFVAERWDADSLHHLELDCTKVYP